jgi:hypothetical protein
MSSVQPIEYRDLAALGFPGYRVGDDGSVWTCWKMVGNGYGGGFHCVMSQTWRRLRPKTRKGYRYVNLKGRMQLVHRLVLEAFVGPCPPGMECCHGPNRGRGRDSLPNLRWGTQQSNETDRRGHGHIRRGERHGLAKATAAAVRDIRRRFATYSGVRWRFLVSFGRKHGLSPAAIGKIVDCKTWRHVQ